MVPKYVVMVMVDNSAFHGNYAKNPFNFKNYNINSLELKLDGETVEFGDALKPDFKNRDVLREYLSLYQSNALVGRAAELPISLKKFTDSYAKFQCRWWWC